MRAGRVGQVREMSKRVVAVRMIDVMMQGELLIKSK